MRELLVVTTLCFLCSAAQGQSSLPPRHELQRSLFITEARGLNASTLNPAGLSVQPDDDGVLLSYDFLETKERGNVEAAMSMSSLGFAFQEFPVFTNNTVQRFRTYALSLSVGGKVLSIGTVNKLIDTGDSPKASLVYSVDAGIILQPVTGVVLAGVARNLDEPVVRGYDFSRSYTAGLGLFFLDGQLKLMAEADWNEQTKFIDEARYRGAVAVSPWPGLEFRAGVFHAAGVTDQFFARIQIPFVGGLNFAGTARLDDARKFLRYSASIIIPLQTAKF
jgi:hypothetical protein